MSLSISHAISFWPTGGDAFGFSRQVEMNKSNYALRLQPSLKAAGERLAAREGTSLNQLINVALVEKLSARETADFFRRRAAQGDKAAFHRFLDEAGDEPPAEGDEIR